MALTMEAFEQRKQNLNQQGLQAQTRLQQLQQDVKNEEARLRVIEGMLLECDRWAQQLNGNDTLTDAESQEVDNGDKPDSDKKVE